MKSIMSDESLVAKCGLYCGACKRYLSDKCPGCAENQKATWCTVRSCNLENNYTTCAECDVGSIDTCKAYNNVMAKLFGFVFRSNRRACIERIREISPAAFADEMTEKRRMSLPR